MRTAALVALSSLSLALAACGDSKPAASAAPDAAAIKAEADKAVAAALAERDAEAVKLHGAPGPSVYFVNLRDGMKVPQSFRVVFGAHGIGVAPALTDKPNTGHHHLIIDEDFTEDEQQYAIPKDEKHLHFGAGETETVLQLAPGQHTLQLVFGDLNHEVHKPKPIMSEKITITVE